MDTLELDRYAAALRARQNELVAGLKHRDGLAAESEPDLFDEMQLAAERALVVQVLDSNSSLLRSVRAALARIEDGSYGRCLCCDDEINPKRLAAVPWAPLCLSCQQDADRYEQGEPAHVGTSAKACLISD